MKTNTSWDAPKIVEKGLMGLTSNIQLKNGTENVNNSNSNEKNHQSASINSENVQPPTKSRIPLSESIKNDSRNFQSEIREERRTEILKVLNEIKADIVSIHQENSSKNNEFVENSKVPIPQTLIDSYYVQQRNKFVRSTQPNIQSDVNQSKSNAALWLSQRKQGVNSPLDVALYFQKNIICVFYSVCHGILAGVAVMQLVLAYYLIDNLHISHNSQETYFKAYQKLSLVGPSCFTFFLSICFVSILDRFDVFHISKSSSRDLISYRRCWIAGLVYFCALLVNSVCFKYDDMISQYQFEEDLVLSSPTPEILAPLVQESLTSNLHNDALDISLSSWRALNFARCLCAIVGWITISFVQPDDLLTVHLESIKSFEMEVEAISALDA